MQSKVIAGVVLMVLGVVLTVLSVPYMSENFALGLIGVIGGVIVFLSSLQPFISAAKMRGQASARQR